MNLEKIKNELELDEKLKVVVIESGYAGSFIYDEYPDKISLDRTGRQICERLREYEEFRDIPMEELYETSGYGRQNPPPDPPPGPPGPPSFGPPPRPPRRQSWLEDVVSVLLYQEIRRRRCRGRKCYR